jgi:hypothetical protein
MNDDNTISDDDALSNILYFHPNNQRQYYDTVLFTVYPRLSTILLSQEAPFNQIGCKSVYLHARTTLLLVNILLSNSSGLHSATSKYTILGQPFSSRDMSRSKFVIAYAASFSEFCFLRSSATFS